MDDWWDVDERAGRVVGQRTGTVIRLGDVCKVIVVNVDEARRELNLAVRELLGRQGAGGKAIKPGKSKLDRKKHKAPNGRHRQPTGATKRNQRSKARSKRHR
jgi:hypothetical protein